MQNVTITSTCYVTHYHTFSLSLAWFGAICNALPRVTIKLIKEYILIFKKKNDGNALQIAQNLENLRENIR